MYKLMKTCSRLISPNRRMHTILWKYVVFQRQIQFQFHFQFMFMAIFRALSIFRNFDIYKVVKDPKTYPMKFHILWRNGLVVITYNYFVLWHPGTSRLLCVHLYIVFPYRQLEIKIRCPNLEIKVRCPNFHCAEVSAVSKAVLPRSQPQR